EHELGSQLDVVARSIPAELSELRCFRGHEQLEQELAASFVQPVRESPQPNELARVQDEVAFGVVAHEHLRERRIELLDVSAELVAELEVELRTPALLDRHRERDAGLPGTACELGPVLLVDEEAGAVLRDTVRD